MENLKLYRIKDEYINYLQNIDHRVQNNKNCRRPYVGIVLHAGAYQYFVPLESPKPNHKNIKAGYHILKLDNGSLGMLGFNNMIPIHKTAIIEFNIDRDPDKKYAELLRRQITYINKNKAIIFEHASKTYYHVIRGNNSFLMKICCNFKKLEKACDKYNPNYSKV